MQVRFRSDAIKTVNVNPNDRLLDALLARNVNAKMLCGGRGICATCHVHVTKNADQLTPRTQMENLSLSLLTGATSSSRLACQARILGNGVEVELPDGLFVESFSDLEALIGQRTSQPILHPITGEVLIQKNKLVVRSLIMQLKNVEFDADEFHLGDPRIKKS